MVYQKNMPLTLMDSCTKDSYIPITMPTTSRATKLAISVPSSKSLGCKNTEREFCYSQQVDRTSSIKLFIFVITVCQVFS